jgi:hypothetical protein
VLCCVVLCCVVLCCVVLCCVVLCCVVLCCVVLCCVVLVWRALGVHFRELAIQIAEQFRALGSPLNIRVSVIIGGLGTVLYCYCIALLWFRCRYSTYLPTCLSSRYDETSIVPAAQTTCDRSYTRSIDRSSAIGISTGSASSSISGVG